MKNIIFATAILVLLTAGCIKGRRSDAAHGKSEYVISESNLPTDYKFSLADKSGEGVDFKEREEIRKAYKLAPNASVKISRINGKLDIETADTDIAEILIIRSAENKEDLDKFRRINIKFKERDKELRISLDSDNQSEFEELFGKTPEIRQRVILRLPEKIMLEVNGVNGPVNIGKIAGKVDASGINGPLNIAEVLHELEMHGVNGNIETTVVSLANKGVELNRINGNINIRFIGDVGAKIEAHGLTGKIQPELGSDYKVVNDNLANYKATVGNGSVRVEFNGITGNITLTRVAQTKK